MTIVGSKFKMERKADLQRVESSEWMTWDSPQCFVSIKSETAGLTFSALQQKVREELCLSHDNAKIEETKQIASSFEDVRIDSSESLNEEINEIKDIYPSPKTTLSNKPKGKFLSYIEKAEIYKDISRCSISLNYVWLKYQISMSTVKRI